MKHSKSVHPLAVAPLRVLLAGLAIPFVAAWAEVPTGSPTFSDPLTIDNLFFPFQPGGTKVYGGSEHGTKVGAIDRYLL